MEGVFTVEGSRGRSYQVDLKSVRCSCRDWIMQRQSFALDDPRRLCKHLIATICENGFASDYTGVDLEALAKKKKGFPLTVPAADSGNPIPEVLQSYLKCVPTEEQVARFRFLFGSGKKAMPNFNFFCAATAHGPTIGWIDTEDAFRVAAERLAWVGIAEQAPDVEAEEVLSMFDLKTLKAIGQALDAKSFGQIKTGIRILAEHPRIEEAFTMMNLDRNSIFALRPLVIEDL